MSNQPNDETVQAMCASRTQFAAGGPFPFSSAEELFEALNRGMQRNPQRLLRAIRRASTGPTLDEMLAGCDFSIPLAPEDEAWLNSPPVGREVL